MWWNLNVGVVEKSTWLLITETTAFSFCSRSWWSSRWFWAVVWGRSILLHHDSDSQHWVENHAPPRYQRHLVQYCKPATVDFKDGNTSVALSTNRRHGRVVFTPSNPALAKSTIRPGASFSSKIDDNRWVSIWQWWWSEWLYIRNGSRVRSPRTGCERGLGN